MKSTFSGKSSQFKSPSFRSARECIPNAHKTTTGKTDSKITLRAADWGSHRPPACTQLDEFSQSTLGARVPKCPAATKGESPPRQQTEKSEARITDLPAWFQQGKPHLIKPMTRWQRSTTAGRRVSCPDMPALKSSQFKSEFPRVLPLPSYGRGRTPPKMREIPARRTGDAAKLAQR